MKTRRIATALALAAAVTLGMSGCGFFVPQATSEPYAPSDGIDQTVEGAEIRNLMLVADEANENFNVVFTGVNTGETAIHLRITFVSKSGSAEASADFEIAPGSTLFGDPEGDVPPVYVSIPDLRAGATVTAFLQVAGGAEVERQVPVLDGTLVEYQDFMPSERAVTEVEDLARETEEADQATSGS